MVISFQGFSNVFLMVFRTFSWVTLGLLLYPEKVMTYFVAFITVFAVVTFKLITLSELLKTCERKLFAKLAQKFNIGLTVI